MPQKESRPNICRIYSEGSFTEANGVPQTADPPHSFTPNKAKPPWSEGGRGSKISRKPPPAPGTYTCAASSALAKRPSCPSMLSLQLPACRKAPLASICDILRQPRERKESVALRTCCCWGGKRCRRRLVHGAFAGDVQAAAQHEHLGAREGPKRAHNPPFQWLRHPCVGAG